MPVNMDPSKKRRKEGPVQQPVQPSAPARPQQEEPKTQASGTSKASGTPDEMTERDRELALADAEWKNLWDATEVIDMDKW
ncbi:hypothetical protein [Candidatus Nitrospira bockiana]